MGLWGDITVRIRDNEETARVMLTLAPVIISEAESL